MYTSVLYNLYIKESCGKFVFISCIMQSFIIQIVMIQIVILIRVLKYIFERQYLKYKTNTKQLYKQCCIYVGIMSNHQMEIYA